MSTRRNIQRILKSKNMSALVTYDGSGRTVDEWGWWTIEFDEDSTDLIRKYNPDFGGIFEFTEPEDGLEDLSLLLGSL